MARICATYNIHIHIYMALIVFYLTIKCMWHTTMFYIAYWHRHIKSFKHYSMSFKSFIEYIIIYQFINMAYLYVWIKFKKEKIKNKYQEGLYKKSVC
jgi:hypothetical protein